MSAIFTESSHMSRTLVVGSMHYLNTPRILICNNSNTMAKQLLHIIKVKATTNTGIITQVM